MTPSIIVINNNDTMANSTSAAPLLFNRFDPITIALPATTTNPVVDRPGP